MFNFKCVLVWVWCIAASAALGHAQTTISGQVTGGRAGALAGANVFIKGSLEGTLSDSAGRYSVTTRLSGQQTLVVTYLGYDPAEAPLTLNGQLLRQDFALREKTNELNTVVISVGSVEADDSKRNVALTSIDIVTTAGAAADIFGAINTLPGTQRVGETEGLFVRGGTATETRTVIDGLLIQNPFNSSVPNVAQRSRFSPFLFKRVEFNTGGFSAQYGQALSGLLILDTKDEIPADVSSQWVFGLNPIGPSLTYSSKLGRKDYLTLDANVGDLSLLFSLVPQNVNWTKPPQFYGSGLQYLRKTSETGLLKIFVQHDGSRLANQIAGLDSGLAPRDFRLRNSYWLVNANYRENLGNWLLRAGFSFSDNRDAIGLTAAQSGRVAQRTQGYLNLYHTLHEKVSVRVGTELHRTAISNDFATDSFAIAATVQDTYVALYVEAEWRAGRSLAFRAGGRGEHASYIRRSNLAPRTSMAVKTGANSQISAAYGWYYQAPEARYLITNENLAFERCDHFLVNYTWQLDKRYFRLEGYYKAYQQLVREEIGGPYDPRPWRQPSPFTNNTGYGYAQGADVFYRDRQSIKNVDFWVSYTYLDTRRLIQNYVAYVTPNFASTHNLNLVAKRRLPKWNVSIAATLTWASGRPYHNPNTGAFMNERLRDFRDLSVSMSKILVRKNTFVVFYASAGNLLGFVNDFGVQYSTDGQRAITITQPALRSFFAGVSLQFSRSKQEVYDPSDPANP